MSAIVADYMPVRLREKNKGGGGERKGETGRHSARDTQDFRGNKLILVSRFNF